MAREMDATEATLREILGIAEETSPSGTTMERIAAAVEKIAQYMNYDIDAEAYAAGTRGGVPVEEGDPAYHNNAAYYAGQMGSVVDDVNELKRATDDNLEKASYEVRSLAKNQVLKIYYPLEYGYINSSGANRADSNPSTQMRTPYYYSVADNIDIIKVKDVTDCRVYIVYYNSDKSFGTRVQAETNETLNSTYAYFRLSFYRKEGSNETVFRNAIEWKIDDLDKRLDDIKIKAKENITANFTYNYGINTNEDVGDVVDTTLSSNTSFCCMIIPVSAKDSVIVTCTGGNGFRAWAVTDTNYKLISKSGSNVTVTNHVITATVDGFVIINALKANTHKVISDKYGYSSQIIDGINSEIEDIYEKIDELSQEEFTPTVEFDFDHNMRDVSSLMQLVDYSDSPGVMDDIYAAFDSLVQDYPAYITKSDIASTLGLSYPTYANGVETAGQYLVTPAYKTYMYTFACSNAGAGNATANKKKKLLIVSAVHGSENAAPFNCYLLLRQLCENITNDPNMFKLRAAFDIYCIPCLNGYGMIHKDEAPRVNANGVNINRNFPVVGWSESGSGTTNYTGPSAGSEFETQIVMGATALIKPDIAIDHHNYFYEDQQFYTDVTKPEELRVAHQALVDCSMAFIKNYPSYYGSGYQLFIQDSTINSAPRSVSPTGNGTTYNYWNENNVPVALLIEICDRIRYVNGAVDSTHLTEVLTDKAFSVAEYTLRNQLLRFCQYALKQEDQT